MGDLGKRHWRQKQSDGVIATETVFQPHENKLYVNTTQPNRHAILKNNERLSRQSGDHRDLARGLRIPEEDFPMVCQRFPNLISGTREEQQAAMTQVMAAHPEFVVIKHRKRFF